MSCQQRRPREVPAARAARPDDVAGDADRRRRSDLVGRAFAEGLLDLAEMDQALDEVLRARTLGELDDAAGILPTQWVAASERSDAAAHRAAARRSAHRRAVATYVGVMALLVGIWALTAVTAGAGHFWPIWPALGWGVPLLLDRSASADTNPDSSRDDGPTERPTG
jgi:hypothetical protein